MITRTIKLKILFDNDMGRIKALCTDTGAGDYIVAVNDQLQGTEKLEALLHEVAHLFRGDLEQKEVPSEEIEKACSRDLTNVAVRILAEKRKVKAC